MQNFNRRIANVLICQLEQYTNIMKNTLRPEHTGKLTLSTWLRQSKEIIELLTELEKRDAKE